MSEFEVGLRLRADGQGLTGELRLTREEAQQLNAELSRTQGSGRKAGDGLGKYGRDATEAGRRSRDLRSQTSGLSQEFRTLRNVLAATGLVVFGRQLLQTVSAMQNAQTRIRGLSTSAADFADNQQFLINTAREYRSELLTLTDSYSRILTLEKARIVTQEEGRRILRGMINVSAEAGASNVQLAQSLYGMTQGFTSGILRAEELNQVVEPLPGLLQRIEQTAGLVSGEFRRMVVEGEVTSEFFKEVLVDALDSYEGAAQRTFGNLSQMWTAIGNEYAIMATKLEEPITDTLTPLANSTIALFRATTEYLPIITSSLAQLTEIVMVGGALYLGVTGLSIAVRQGMKIYAAAASTVRAYALASAMGATATDVLSYKMNQSANTAKLLETRLGRLKVAASALGSFYAGFALGDTLNNFQIVRTTALRFMGLMLQQFENLKFAGKALWLTFETAFANATSGIKTGYAEMLDFIAGGLDLVGADQMAKVYTDYAANLRNGVDVEVRYSAALSALNEERATANQAIRDNIAGLIEAERQGINTVEQLRAGAAAAEDWGDGADAGATATKVFSEAQRKLIDELLPLNALHAEYQKNLAELTSIVPQTTADAELKEEAIRALNAAYRAEVSELDGSLARHKLEEDALQRQLQLMDQVVDQYAPLQFAETEYQRELEALNLAREMGYLTIENYSLALQQLEEDYNELANPAAHFLENLEEQVALLEEENHALQTGNSRRLAEIRLRQQNVDATDEQVAAYAELLTRQTAAEHMNERLTDQAEPWEELWIQSIRRVDRSMFNFFRSGLDGMREWKNSMVDMAKDLAAELAYLFAKQKLFGAAALGGGLTFSGSAAAAGNAGAGGSSIASLVAGSAGAGTHFLSSMLSNSALAASNLLYDVGLDGLGNVAVDRAFKTTTMSNGGALVDLGLSMAAGYAGNYAGGKLGNALFNKQAESNIGGTLLGTAGGVIGGPLGAFIGSTIGALIDTAFGGDGKKDVRAGLLVNPAANSANNFQVNPFASGFAPIGFAERVSEEVATQVIDVFRAADSTFAEITRASGRSVDYSKLDINALNGRAQPGSSGLFFGLAGENGLPGTEVLAGQVEYFTRQLIAHVPDLRDEIVDILEATTGDVDTLLATYRDLLSLDSVFGPDAQIFSDIASFEETFEMLTGTLRREGEALGQTAVRVGQSMAALQRLGIGDRSSTSAAFANQVEAELGIENLQSLVQSYTEIYHTEAERLGHSVEILTGQVTDQLNALGLSIDSFDSLESFRAHFESVQSSLDAVDLAKYLQVAVSLGQLIDLRERESDAIKETAVAISGSLRANIDLISQARGLGSSLSQSILRARGATPLHPELGLGTLDQRLATVRELQQLYERQHAEQVARLREVHEEEMRQYEERMAAQASLNDFIRAIGYSEFAPVSAAERLQLAREDFNRLVSVASASGSANDVSAAQNAFDGYIRLARTQYASSQEYVDLFNEARGKLVNLSGQLGSGSRPGALDTSSADNLLVSQLQTLQGELARIEEEATRQVVDELVSLHGTVGDIEAIAEALLEEGVPRGLIIDLIAQNTTLVAAANQLLASLGSGQTVQSMQGGRTNSGISDQQISNFVSNFENTPAGARSVIQWAKENNIGSAQLAGAVQDRFPGLTSAELVELSGSLGLGSFYGGTDRIERDGLNLNHADEIIFSPTEANSLRRKVVSIVSREAAGGSGGAQWKGLEAGFERLSATLEKLMVMNHKDSSAGQAQMAALITSLQEEMEGMRRELEDRAA